MRAFALLAALVLAAGCLGTPDDAADAATAPPVDTSGARPEPTFGEVSLGPAAAPDLTATLAAPPRLVKGEWWKIELSSPFGEPQTFIRVVADVEGDTYIFGMPHEGWWKEAVIYHTPAFGEVNAADLSFKAHDIPFKSLQFPLEDGATWETNWETTDPITATVKVESETRAVVTFTGDTNFIQPGIQPGVTMELVYDATMHEVVEFRHPGVTFTVVEHGYGFEGWVTVPRGEKLVFLHGRIGPALDMEFQPNPFPIDTVEVKGGYNRVSFILVAGNFLPPGQGGAFLEKAKAPDGTEYKLEQAPGRPVEVVFLEHTNPDGVWELTHVAGGGGVAFIEGIAYHQYDIHLPSGAIRSDHSHEVIR